MPIFAASPAPWRREALRRAMPSRFLPGGQEAIIKAIVLFDTQLPLALPKQSVTLTLDREVDVSRGNVIVPQILLVNYLISLTLRLWMDGAMVMLDVVMIWC